MNYEYKKQEYKEQELKLTNRKRLEITGVNKLENLNPEEFLVQTNLGVLLVRGNNLEMQHLDIEKGILWITGTIYSLEYLEEKGENKKEGFFKKLFK